MSTLVTVTPTGVAYAAGVARPLTRFNVSFVAEPPVKVSKELNVPLAELKICCAEPVLPQVSIPVVSVLTR